MYYITKEFKGYPFAHRQWKHDGHCALIHGHNWDFRVVLKSDELDENGFIFDFGKFGDLKKWFNEKFDHTTVLNENDPEMVVFKLLNKQGFLDLVIVESCSCEGIAKFIYDHVKEYMHEVTDGRVQLVAIDVYEDEKNSARYTGDQ